MTSSPQRFERLMLVGALHVDDIAHCRQSLVPRASNPVCWTQQLGGVAANAAMAAARTGIAHQRIELAAAVGADALAGQLQQALLRAGITASLQRIDQRATGRYTAVMDADGELYIGLSAVSLAESLEGKHVPLLRPRSLRTALLMDANLSEACLHWLSEQAHAHGIRQVALSVSPAKARRLLPLAGKLDLLICNRREAMALIEHTAAADFGIERLADALMELGFQQFILSDGTAPLVIQAHMHRHVVPVPAVSATHSVNGAGDALAGASFAAWCNGSTLVDAVTRYGLSEAARVVRGEVRVPLMS